MAAPLFPYVWKAVEALHYACPLVILTYYVIASILSICTLESLSVSNKSQGVRRNVILWLMFGITFQYIAQASLFGARSWVQKDWVAGQDEVVYVLSSVIVWAIQSLMLLESEFPVWYPYFINWDLAIFAELTLLVVPNIIRKQENAWDFVSIAFHSLRLGTFIALHFVYVALRVQKDKPETSDVERQPLLGGQDDANQVDSEEGAQGENGYGATTKTSQKKASKKFDEDAEYLEEDKNGQEIAKQVMEDGGWWAYARRYLILFPYIWPIHSKGLQFRAVLVGVCLLGSNILNVMVPRQLGAVTDALVNSNGRLAWIEALLYAALTFANSDACIGWLRQWLWLPLEQYSYNTLTTAAQSHAMNLSSDFHEKTSPPEIHQAIWHGRTIMNLVDSVCFNILPMFVDLALVFAFLYHLFGPYMALNLAMTTLVYLYSSVKLADMVSAVRRPFWYHSRKEWRSASASFKNWQLASYFNNIGYETGSFASKVEIQLKFKRKYLLAWRMMAAVQGLTITVGLLGACALAVYQVMHGIRSPGDFVILVSYWAQLKGPLVQFSTMYKEISDKLMDAEKLLKMFRTKSTITDSLDARPLRVKKGEVTFSKVRFAYDERKVNLKEIDFKISGGSTVAIVGETGGGKSTILKLLDRFYDPASGSIQIDGQDIREVTLRSLRESIGVVMQDPNLFQDTIMNNVRYGRLTASDEEVREACKKASIHDKIMEFPDDYESNVGDSGIKLSGGEKQRIAIARAFLKKPQIVLLDEATSAVDTETECAIQEAFKALCHGRTTFVVAHRLSTVMRADRILVLKDGSIIEDGTHNELIHAKGKYHDLWSKQILPTVETDSSASELTSAQILSTKDAEQSRGRSKSPQITPDKVNERSKSRSKSPRKPKLAFAGDADAHATEDSVTTEQVPKLKPDAPVFVPRHLRLDSQALDNAAPVETKQEVKDRLKKERDEKKQEKEELKSQISLAKKAAKTKNGIAGQQEGLQESGNEPQESNDASAKDDGNYLPMRAPSINVDKGKARSYRFKKRRRESKSEPTIRNMDGVDDSEEFPPITSGNSQSLPDTAIMNRRISAPSDSLSRLPNRQSSSFSGRHRRPHHWRKIRPAAQLNSSAAANFTNSQGRSTDDAGLPNTHAAAPVGEFQSTG